MFQVLQIGQGVGAGHGFDAAHTSSDTAFRHHLEQTNVARGVHMGAATEFAAGPDVQHPHGVAVLLAKQHHGAGFLRGFQIHHPGLGGGVGQNLGVHTGFNLADFSVGDGCVVGEVEAGALVVHQGAFLLHMRPQHIAQGLVHQVRGAVVAHRGGTQVGINASGEHVAHFQAALRHVAMVAKHIGLDFQGVFHHKLGGLGRFPSQQPTLVAHLTAALGVKRCGVQHHHAHLL